jgi:hypothetical protein
MKWPTRQAVKRATPAEGRKVALLLAAAACLGVAAAGIARREQVAFAARCWANGNRLPACVCTYNALAELPANYRALAVSWAHDSGTAYAAGVMQLAITETWRVGSARIARMGSAAEREQGIRSWVWRTGEAIGWTALQQAAPAVAAYAAPVAAALPFVDDALGEFANAQEVLDRHCGTGKTFLVRIYETRKAAAEKLEALATQTTGVALETGRATAEAGANLAARMWHWTKSWF